MLYRAELLPDGFLVAGTRKSYAGGACAANAGLRRAETRRAALSDGPVAFQPGTDPYFFLPFFAFLAGFFADFEGFLAAFFMAMMRFLRGQVPVRELWIETSIGVFPDL